MIGDPAWVPMRKGYMRPNAINLMSYGLLALPVAFAGLPLFIHAPDYYATDLGVSLAAMGACWWLCG